MPLDIVLPDPLDIIELPVAVNLYLYRGDDFSMVLRVSDADGLPIDLGDPENDASAAAQIRANPDAPDVLGVFSLGLDGDMILAHLFSVTSQELPAMCVYDVELVMNGLVTTLIAGTIFLTADVTRL